MNGLLSAASAQNNYSIPFFEYPNGNIFIDRAATSTLEYESESIANWVGTGLLELVDSSIDPLNVRNGQYALKLTTSNGATQNARYDQLPFTARANETLTASFWFKCEVGVRVRLTLGTDINGGTNSSAYIEGNGGWQQVTHSIVSSGEISTFALVVDDINAVGSVVAYFDDIEVKIPSITKPTPKEYFGGRGTALGGMYFPWNSPELDLNTNIDGSFILGTNFKLDSAYNNSLTKVGDELRFYLNPNVPDATGNPSPNNYRNELSQIVGVEKIYGLEEWDYFTYRFGDGFTPDPASAFLFFQHKHPDGLQTSPVTELLVTRADQFGDTGGEGEIAILHDAHASDSTTVRFRTGFFPEGSKKYHVVIHTISALKVDGGLLQVWIWEDGTEKPSFTNPIFSIQESTLFSDRLYASARKFGIYKFDWNNDPANVQASIDAGVTEVETFLGPLRRFAKRPTDATYGKNEFKRITLL